jgi:Ca-activated chloride channel family protein
LSFAHPIFLLGLLAVPLLAWSAWKKSQRTAPGLRYSATADAEALPNAFGTRLKGLPTVLSLLALALALTALARPQRRDVTVERTAEGIDIMLVLDVSTSMTAEDFYPNRFEAAKVVGADFIGGRVSDRIGLVVFAAQAYTQAPLTLDYPFLRRMLFEVRMGLIEDGTAIGTALATATARLRDSEAESKVIILLTDGQNNRGEIDPTTAAEVAEALGVKIYAIGVGGEGGRVGAGIFGPFHQVPEVDEATLREVAGKTGGRYFRAADAEALRSIYEAISELERTEIEETSYVDVDERYHWFLWPALGVLLLNILLVNTRLRRVP